MRSAFTMNPARSLDLMTGLPNCPSAKRAASWATTSSVSRDPTSSTRGSTGTGFKNASR